MEDDKANRVNLKDLPQAQQELTAEESKEVQGGQGGGIVKLGSRRLVITGDSTIEPSEAVGVFNSGGQRLGFNDDTI